MHLSFKYKYAVVHSSGLMVSLSGIMRLHSSLNSSVRKSSGTLRTPDYFATPSSCFAVTTKPVVEGINRLSAHTNHTITK